MDDTAEIRESINAKNQRLQIPIFSIAFGREADFKFLSQISEMNKGFARRVYEDNDATMQVIYRKYIKQNEYILHHIRYIISNMSKKSV